MAPTRIGVMRPGLLGIVSLLAFMANFLDLKKSLSLCFKINNVLVGAGLTAVVLDFVTVKSYYRPLMIFHNIYLVVSLVFLVVAGIVLLLRRDSNAFAATPGWICLLVGSTVYVLRVAGLVPSTFFTDHAMIFGASAEALLFSLALGNRINIFAKQKYEIQLKEEKSRKFRTLVHVLCHDLVNQILVTLYHSELRLGLVDGEPMPKEFLEKIDEVDKEHWNKVYRATRESLDLLKLVQQLETLENENQKLELESVSLLTAVEESLLVFDHRLHEKHISIRREYPANAAELNIIAERVGLKNSVINNLISNAIKFSHEHGAINIRLETRGKEVGFEVRDSGVGMSKEIAATLFSPDLPVSKWGTKGEKGTGFGFQLIRSTLKRYGARIEIESVEAPLPSEVLSTAAGSGTSMKVWFKTASDALTAINNETHRQ